MEKFGFKMFTGRLCGFLITDEYMNSTVLDRPYQAERTDEQTPRVNVRGICQAVLFIFIVIYF